MISRGNLIVQYSRKKNKAKITMKKFDIAVSSRYVEIYTVQAENEEEAVRILKGSIALMEPIARERYNNDLDFIEVINECITTNA